MELLKEKSMWVVKIGGSMLGSHELARWLEVLAKFSDGNIIIVPGGGIFADAVRQAQTLSGISDRSAHHLALLAMDQFGLMLADLNPKLVTAKSELEIDERTWQHRCIIWLPSEMVLAEESIPQDWGVTSDSIAAWLATRLNAKQLVLLKSNTPTGQSVSIYDLQQTDIVDKSFSTFVENQQFGCWLLHKAKVEQFANGVSEENLIQTAVRVLR